MLLAFSVPAGNERGPQYAEQALAALHQANASKLPIHFGFATLQGEVQLFCRASEDLRERLERQLYGQYPDAHLERLADNAVDPPAGMETERVGLCLTPDLFPLKRYGQFEDVLNHLSADPLAALLHTLLGRHKHPFHASVSLLVRPARRRVVAARVRCLRALGHPFFRSHPRLAGWLARVTGGPWWARWLAGVVTRAVAARRAGRDQEIGLTVSSGRTHEHEEDLHSAGDKLRQPLFEVRLEIAVSGPAETAARSREKIQEIAGAFGAFAGRRARFALRRKRVCCFLLSSEEVATLWHPATQTVQIPTLKSVGSRERPPPVDLPSPRDQADLALVGLTRYRGTYRKFGLLTEERFRHLALLGKTGMGKSTLLHRLVASDVTAGRGVALLDPHGDLVEGLLRAIPRERTNDVIYFDPADRDNPVAFNPLCCRDPQQRPLVASGLVSALKKIYADSWGPRLEHYLRAALLALLEVPDATLVTLSSFLNDSGVRNQMLRHVHDPLVRSIWLEEFAHKPTRLQEESLSPIQNKVGQFLSSPLLRNVLGQARGKLDLRRVLDEGKILLCNLSKGKLGDDASKLLGSFLVTGLEQAALSRADVSEAERRPFFLFVDEFQNYSTESFATLLSEARKYRLAVTVANQYLGQLDEQTLHALFGNVQNMVCFQVGATDAELIAQQLGGDLTVQDLQRLPRYHAYARVLLATGEVSHPFSMQSMPVRFRHKAADRAEVIRRTSAHRYARPVEQVEQEIEEAWAGLRSRRIAPSDKSSHRNPGAKDTSTILG